MVSTISDYKVLCPPREIQSRQVYNTCTSNLRYILHQIKFSDGFWRSEGQVCRIGTAKTIFFTRKSKQDALGNADVQRDLLCFVYGSRADAKSNHAFVAVQIDASFFRIHFLIKHQKTWFILLLDLCHLETRFVTSLHSHQ
jgi:hypothetical protein